MDSSRSHAGRPGESGANGSQKSAPRDGEATGFRGLIRRGSAFFERRRVALAIVFGALVLTDVTVTLSLPASYRATATVTVEAARLPEDLKPLVPSVQERIGRLTGLALSDQHLSELARECPRLAQSRVLRLFEGGPSSPVQAMRDAIAVETRGRTERTELVLISVTGERADETAHVASAVAWRLVRLDRDFRIEAACATDGAVRAEVVADTRPIAELAARIEKLRAENPLMATTSDAAIRAQLEQEGRALDEDQIAQVELAASLPLLESEVARWAHAVQEEAEVARRAAAAAEAAKAAAAKPAADDPKRHRLVELEKQLVQARSHWTEQNPEVKRLIREIALEREYLGEPDPESEETPSPRAPTERSAAPRDGGMNGGGMLGGKNLEVRPAADARVESRFLIEAPAYRSWREAVARLEAAKTRDTAVKARIQRRSGDLARLRGLVDKLPEKRLELTRLEGERDRLLVRAAELAERLARVESAWKVEVREGRAGACTERLALATAALVPLEVGPDRLLVFFVGLLIAAPLAVLTAYIRDAHDRSLHTDDEVARALALPVLGVIPRIRGRR